MSDRKTYRIVTRAVSSITYEIDAESEEEAREFYTMGTVVRNEWDYDDIESVVEVEQQPV